MNKKKSKYKPRKETKDAYYKRAIYIQIQYKLNQVIHDIEKNKKPSK